MTTRTTIRRAKLKMDLFDTLVRALRSGADGVQRWNARTTDERRSAGDYRGIDLSGAALAGVDLGSLDFAEANFDMANLTGAWLLETDLTRASFEGANLERAWCAEAKLTGANFRRASLHGGNLRGCECRDTDFTEADLDSASLAGANLCGSDLSSAILRGASLEQARYDERTRWPQAFHLAANGDRIVWAGTGAPPLDFDGFVKSLSDHVDPGRLRRALDMLKAERFQLYSQVEPGALAGVIRSQRDPRIVYSCRLESSGAFACCSQDLSLCLGQRGALCKHLIVLVIALTRAGQIDAATVERWVLASKGNLRWTLTVNRDLMSEPLLRFSAAQAGEIDWRPTETIPEDYYAL